MDLISTILWILGVILVMVFCCYWNSGIANIPGSIIEKKSTPEERAAERGTVRGGKRQSA
jgi:uncharacterized membrane protein